MQHGIPLVPFRTLAADIGRYKKSEPSWKGKGGLVPPGTRVYIREYDGIQLPDGTRHDGWFVVNDTGGGIFGAHFDVFVGTRALRKQMKLPPVGTVWFPNIEQRIPPGYDYGLKA
jgi:membrane-bound lytic murein transglycosylase